MTGPITAPPGEPPTIPPKTGAAMNTCPCCGWPLGDRSFAPRNGVAPCVADRYADVTRPYAVVDGVHGWVTV